MAQRVFVHIGTPKSGTTYLQSLWWHNATALADQWLLLPGASADVQFQASAVVRANEAVLATMTDRQLGAWDRLVEEVEPFDGDALISQEQLVEASHVSATAALARLRGVAEEVHVVVTARDLVRQVPSAWQQRVKHGSPSTLRRFFTRVAKDDPDFNFWHHQDVPRILERWTDGVPPEHVHVVPLPRPGADRDLLWRRTCALLDIEDFGLDLDAPVANETLAPAEIAFHRAVNAHFRNAHLDVALSRRVKAFMEPRLGGAPAQRIALAPDMHAWLVERGNRMVDELAAAPWHVVGDLDDLRPDPAPSAGVDPDAVPDSEVLAVAQEFLAAELLARAEPAGGGAVSEPHSEPPEGGSRTALGRVLRRLTGGR
ncbi:hypothetical protein SAMN04489844_2766 [Nocardioides exalbidus]|uniref:Sulfotransferase family protein n=1 Tax=Nocardioides exalbidus TaxID=402596 RepID=A0A1H4UGV1_9ACTN|nr:hypothetical protein [Nocardioides exalbidus]SEC67969.1 hypothetical protein SAMN04489844_2766 [Nocardioides exalbidus]